MKFTSDNSVNGWGWRFTVYPIMPAAGPKRACLSDRCILSCLHELGHMSPGLQGSTLPQQKTSCLSSAASLACAQLSALDFAGDALAAALVKVYQRLCRGSMVLVALATNSLELDTYPAALRPIVGLVPQILHYPLRVAVALDKNLLPRPFLDEVLKIRELVVVTRHEQPPRGHDIRKRARRPFVQWMNRRPGDWTLSAENYGTIYGWAITTGAAGGPRRRLILSGLGVVLKWSVALKIFCGSHKSGAVYMFSLLSCHIGISAHEYNHLQERSPSLALRNRHCSPSSAYMGADRPTGPSEAAFRKVVPGHNDGDRQRTCGGAQQIQVKRSRCKGGLAGPDGTKSVFGQMCAKMSSFSPDSLLLPHRVWKVKFVGESVDDCGGGYSESIAEMCEELQNALTPLLIVTPNGRDESGANRDCFLLNPAAKSPLHMSMFRFLGVLLGIAIRTGSPLSLNLAEPVWKQLAGMNLTIADLSEVDKDFIPGLMYIRDNEATAEEFEAMTLPFTVPNASGQDIQLSSKYSHITLENRAEYVRLAINYRLHEFDEQVSAVREGMARVVPVPLLSLFTGYELETMVCGSPDIPLHLLKSVATYKGVEPTAPLIQWFWEVMESFSNTERSLFLRFVWGRTRLPRTIADFRGRDFVVQVLDKYNPPDHFLPESYTCFFLLKLPRYSCKQVLEEKLKYAIHFCKSIDTDDYARIALSGEPAADDSSEDSDNEDADSFASDSTQDYLTGH
ncbi:E3 ubiquitin-protein ligase HERC2 isoform X1 [Lates japonicus]|uniref:HECT-type E3 ubiquitin transferase n=1 Tax=Lates japonicus TaxID=270547 RepID=A0AAD3N4P2_LATJO|nr:E3 ubiquitin-protein ligase HERC2 isoform X1 [Lates japonicus]